MTAYRSRGAKPNSDKIAKVARPPEVHHCATCGAPNAPCGMGDAWFCPWPCAPAEYWPAESQERLV